MPSPPKKCDISNDLRAANVCWVCKNLCPFSIVHDQGFKILIKTGRPEYYLPSSSTVSHNVRVVFANVQKQMAKMMKVSFKIQKKFITNFQEYKGYLNFATNTWTSPNHKAFIVVSVHFEQKGKPLCLVLDVIEVAKV